MIFVTVGTHWFDALVEAVDVAVGRGALQDPVVLQIGYAGKYIPRHCRYLTGAPTLAPFYEVCDLVVGHGGTGTTIEVLMMGKPLISVANPSMQDNHQHEFLTALETEGWVSYCRDLNDLPAMINERRAMRRTIGAGRQLAVALSRELESLRRPRSPATSRLARIGGMMTRSLEIDVARTDRNTMRDLDVWSLVRSPSGVDCE